MKSSVSTLPPSRVPLASIGSLASLAQEYEAGERITDQLYLPRPKSVEVVESKESTLEACPPLEPGGQGHAAEAAETWARMYPGVAFGNYVTIGRNVSIGPGSTVGHGVVLHDDSRIGCDVRMDDGSVIGKDPMGSRSPLPPAVIGSGCFVGTHAVVYRGARIGDRVRIADLTTIGEQTRVGELTVIGRGVSVESQVTIGTRCTIETGAHITAQSTLGNLCFVASKVSFTSDRCGARRHDVVRRQEVGRAPVMGVTMWDGARVGANATVLPGVVIGADALVGAGSVVIRDVAPRMVVMGAPARAVRMVTPEQLLAHLSIALETGGGA